MVKNFQNHYFRTLDTNQKIRTTRKTYNQEKNNSSISVRTVSTVSFQPALVHLPLLSSVVDLKKTASISSTDTNSGDSRTDVIHTQRCEGVCFDMSGIFIEKSSRDLVLSHPPSDKGALQGRVDKTLIDKHICYCCLEQ